jgi:anti-sigma-K factor RskA
MADEPRSEHELDEIEALLRELDEDDLVLEAPPTSVWTAIDAEISAGGNVALTEQPVVVPFRRRHAWLVPALAAAAVVLVVVGAVAFVRSRGDDTTTLATAQLAFDATAFDPAGADAEATAVLVDDGDAEVLELVDESLPFDLDEDATLELWMIRVDGGEIIDMVSLGDISSDGSRAFAVPEGYDPREFSVVDISVEPHDGDATHSGRSILRGELEPT